MKESFQTRDELLEELQRLRERLEEVESRTAFLELRTDAPSTQLDNVYFRQLFQNSPDGIVLLDDQDCVLDCNRGFERIFGYSPREARGRPINSLIVPDEHIEEASALSKKALAGETVASEKIRRRKDGSRVDVRILGYPILDRERQIGVFGIYSDISRRRRAEQTLRLQGAAMRSAANAIFITDRAGRIVWINSAFTQLSGYGESEALGARPSLLQPGRGGDDLDPEFWCREAPGGVWRGQVACRHRDGGLYTVEQTVTRIENPGRQTTHFVVVQEDISARIAAEDRLQHLSRHDFLTDLPNRYTLGERLEFELERASRTGHRVAVLLLDLDHFKDVNDTYGHPLGDDLLLAVAERLRRIVSSAAALSRTGGDEFAVVHTDFTELETVDTLARQLVKAFHRPFVVAGRRIHITASAGVAFCPPGDADPRHLLKKADLALYRAKEERRGSYRLHTEDMDRRAQDRMRIGQELHGALRGEELYLEYQPQIELPSGSVVGVEALLRWQHPRRGRMAPERFIPIAEGSGLVVPIGEWVLRAACREARRWQQADWPELPVSVNVSAVQFRHPGFAAEVARVLEDTGVVPPRLELELTEGVLMRPTSAVERNLEELEELGVRFALDDFGKGYSSLAYLRRLRLHKLKIDRAFVMDLEREPSQGVIVSAVTALGRQLGLQVIAEGVESRPQLESLLAKGCYLIQGDHICPAVPVETLRTILLEGRGRIPGGGLA